MKYPGAGSVTGNSEFFQKRQGRRGERWCRVKLTPTVASTEDKRSDILPPGVPNNDLQTAPLDRPWLQFVVSQKLRPGSIHTFRLRFRNSVGWSEYSFPAPEARVLSDVPLPPFDVFPTTLSPFSILVRWKAPHHNGAPLTQYRLQACRMRGCPDPDDSDSEEDCASDVRQSCFDLMKQGAPMPFSRGEYHAVPEGVRMSLSAVVLLMYRSVPRYRERRARLWPVTGILWVAVCVCDCVVSVLASLNTRCSVVAAVADGGSRVGPWEDIPVSDWISRRLGERIPRMMHVASAGKQLNNSESEDSDMDTPRDTYVINDDTVDRMDVTMPSTQEELKELEEWVQSKQTQLIRERTNPTVKRRGSDVAITLTVTSDDAMDDETVARLQRIESTMGPRLKRTHGTQLAWLVGGLRPGTWHSFRVNAANAEGQGPFCEPTGFIRTFGTPVSGGVG